MRNKDITTPEEAAAITPEEALYRNLSRAQRSAILNTQRACCECRRMYKAMNLSYSPSTGLSTCTRCCRSKTVRAQIAGLRRKISRLQAELSPVEAIAR